MSSRMPSRAGFDEGQFRDTDPCLPPLPPRPAHGARPTTRAALSPDPGAPSGARRTCWRSALLLARGARSSAPHSPPV